MGRVLGVLGTGAALLCALIGLGTGAYPAFVLSGFHPIEALRGKQRQKRGVVRLRRVLVGSQLFVTLLFVLTATVVVAQLRYITTKDLGFEPEQVLYARLWDRVAPARYETIKRILLKNEAVRAVSYGRLPGEHSLGFQAEDASGRSILVYRTSYGPGYAETLGIEMAAGHDFAAGDAAATGGLLLNASAARLLSEELQMAYTQERQLARLLALFSAVAIAIAYLGLFAMISYILQRRKQEIAIRRILGASGLRLGLRLSSESVGLYAAAAAAALGAVAALSSWWLREFAYHTTALPSAFAFVLTAVLLITLTAVWYQVARTIAEPPAQALRQA